MSSETPIAASPPEDAHRASVSEDAHRASVSEDARRLSVFGWRYVSRVQTERTIALARVVLASASLFAVWLDPSEPSRFVRLTYTLHSIYLLYAAVLAISTRHRPGPSRLPLITHIVDITVFSVFQYLTLGPSSPFFVYFVFSLFCGALRWGWRGTMATAVAVMLSFVVMGDTMSLTLGATAFELNRFIIRAVYLAVAAVLLVYLGQHEARLRAQIERLAGWPSVEHGDAEAVVRRVLSHGAAILGAPRAIAVWEIGEEPWRHVAVWSSAEFSMNRHSPEDFEPVVPLALVDGAFVTAGPISDAAVVVVNRGDVLSEWRGRPIHADLPVGRQDAGLVSAPFQTDRLSGRIILCDLVLPTPDILPLTEVIARETGASLDQLHVSRRLAEVTLSEERIRVARDLHDGVLQSLTGLRLELQSVATGVGDEQPSATTRERLINIERAIAMEQRELRLFIAGLQPTSRPDSTAGSMVAQLEQVRERIVLEWKMPVSLRIGSCPQSLPTALAQGLPLMVHEAIVNALKHAQPSRVSVDVLGDERCLRVVVSDDGRGFPFRGRYDDAALAEMSAGPLSLRARVASLGGKVTVESTTSGSRVEIDLPVTRGGA
jgi:signal transduction histidine kinase